MEEDPGDSEPKEVKELMMKMRGMTMDKREEVIDALVTQENF
jgi:hypothetical protein